MSSEAGFIAMGQCLEQGVVPTGDLDRRCGVLVLRLTVVYVIIGPPSDPIYLPRRLHPKGRSAQKLACSTPALEKDTLGFSNRLAADWTTTETRSTNLAGTPMAARDKGYHCLPLQANNAFRSLEDLCSKRYLQFGEDLSHGGPFLGSIEPAAQHHGPHGLRTVIGPRKPPAGQHSLCHGFVGGYRVIRYEPKC